MHVYINGQIYNMDQFETCRPEYKDSQYPHRIEFLRGGECVEYVSLKSRQELDSKWNEIVQMVQSWYS